VSLKRVNPAGCKEFVERRLSGTAKKCGPRAPKGPKLSIRQGFNAEMFRVEDVANPVEVMSKETTRTCINDV
jgi:hypothetical protein